VEKSGKTWYIVAGGPSLLGFDWRALDDRCAIAVNRAFEKLPLAKVVYFTDHEFWKWHSESLRSHRGRLITGAANRHVDDPLVENWGLTGPSGLETRSERLRHGNSSGYAAINVAYHLGARRIYLLGYDFKYHTAASAKPGSITRSHWHTHHPRLHRERVFEKMLPHFPALARELASRGVLVWNANPDSALRVFPFCTVGEAISNNPPMHPFGKSFTYAQRSRALAADS